MIICFQRNLFFFFKFLFTFISWWCIPLGHTRGSQRQLVNDWFSPIFLWVPETEQRSAGSGAINSSPIPHALREFFIRQCFPLKRGGQGALYTDTRRGLNSLVPPRTALGWSASAPALNTPRLLLSFGIGGQDRGLSHPIDLACEVTGLQGMRVMPSFLQHCSTGVSQCNESWQKGNGLCIQAVK